MIQNYFIRIVHKFRPIFRFSKYLTIFLEKTPTFSKLQKIFSDVFCIALIEHFLDIEMEFFGRVVKIAFCLVIGMFGTKFFFEKQKTCYFFKFYINRVENSAKAFRQDWQKRLPRVH